MKVITFSSDDRYNHLLLNLLNSFHKTNVKYSFFYIVHYEISPIFQKACQNIYPNLVFVKKERETDNYVKINSSRFKHFIEVIKDYFSDGDKILIIDCDTLILKDFSSVYSQKFDIGFTYKVTGFPINFGVIFGKISIKFHETINYIYNDLKLTLENRRSLKFATAISGAADQHSINKLVNSDLLTPDNFSPALRKKLFENISELSINNHSVGVKFLDCDLYNQTECVSDFDNVNIVHYKSGWHLALKNRSLNFLSKYRSYDQCKNLFNFWIDSYSASISRYNSSLYDLLVKKNASNAEKIKLPIYKEGGILPSELVFLNNLIELIEPDLIIESGRYNGVSTEFIKINFPDIILISYDFLRDKIALNTEKKLSKYDKLNFLYGDTRYLMINELSKTKIKYDRVLVLLDGPKGKDAFDLMNKALQYKNVASVVVHDSYIGSEFRNLVDEQNIDYVSSDNTTIVNNFKLFDENIDKKYFIDKPYSFNDNSSSSYGPTLVAAFSSIRNSDYPKVNYFIKLFNLIRGYYVHKLIYFTRTLLKFKF